MKEAYIQAAAYGDRTTSLFGRLFDLFVREPSTPAGLGVYYLVDLVAPTGSCGARHVISVFCSNHDIPVCEVPASGTIRDIVKHILETSPLRCAIVLDTRDNALMQKVRARLATTHCDLRYKRIVFCLTDQDMPSGSSSTSLHVPGSTDDKMIMLLYHTPSHLRNQAASLDCFRPLAEAMVDYTLFQPRVWRDVDMNSTLEAFLSTAMYQILRQVRTDPGIGDAYPSFETHWRSTMARRLKDTLDVCRELRDGHRQIAQELSKMQDRFDLLQNNMQDRFDLLQKGLVAVADIKRPHGPETRRESESCRKRGCTNIVVERFANGKKRKQCRSCIDIVHRSRNAPPPKMHSEERSDTTQ